MIDVGVGGDGVVLVTKDALDVDTVGKNKKVIEEYIRNQLTEDEMMDQMTIKEYIEPFAGSKNGKA